MKQLFFILMLLLTTVSFAQEEQKSTEQTLTEMVKPYAEKLLKATEQGVEYAIEEVPIVVQQYLMYNAVYYTAWVLLGFALVFFAKKIALRLTTIKYKAEKDENGNPIPPKWRGKSYHNYVLVGNDRWLLRDTDADSSTTTQEFSFEFIKYLSVILGILLILCNIFTSIQLIFFPKLFLVEKFLTIL